MIAIQLLDNLFEFDVHHSFGDVLNSFNLTLGLFEPQVIGALIHLDLVLLFLQLLLVILFLHRIALSIVSVATPYLQADPTEVVSTSASHVNTPSVLINVSLAHRALLSHDLIQPLLVFGIQYLVPRL